MREPAAEAFCCGKLRALTQGLPRKKPQFSGMIHANGGGLRPEKAGLPET
jgi:hypothetical protein